MNYKYYIALLKQLPFIVILDLKVLGHRCPVVKKGLRLFFILNAFHCEFLAFCFQLSIAQLFLLRLFVGFKFKFCCEVGSWKLNIANGLLHVLKV